MGEILKTAVDHNYAFWICLLVSVSLLIAGFLCPPLAVIDNSVIIAVGELIGFGGLYALIKAIDKGTATTFKHKNTEISISKKNDENE